MVKRSEASIVADMDDLFIALIKGKPEAQRTLSFNLYQATLAVAVHGTNQVSAELTKRVATWRAGRVKRANDETTRFRTAHAVKHSKKPKSRAARGENAYEEVGKLEGIAPSTVEKRRYRKPRS